ncbi:2-amino-4-hydroxy-6-hydroxymethyldihydropteridine pyrophosphokinase [Novosphingobium sp. AAP83]|uniref:2-amino-4-hydroxy-6- hydroxymethyldihydropteridine diphosphokinase n=1 Tax=Novosphingobium sp. AAP83 TaxID=1523425 RepID=UPI0006B98222|nr:2-amino-4-hydroxy-6-hydroxymethyldihydropteridine diphosphokinase [Novosphingobium sp. AAP83]KPF93380.1 2-amino-4-hydroxy-6-hydroxymethyldihydropteridine pyrophosphokinase [Novosphingobium sp. AAP83]
MNRYVIALGSNQRHARYGSPSAILRAALAELVVQGVTVAAASPVLRSRPIGPSLREYANGAVVVEIPKEPLELLDLLQSIEYTFGRRRQGQRWRSRTLDLDIVLWNGGGWADERLTIPHAEFRKRDFVLRPAARIAPDWRDPLTGLTLKHLFTRLTRRGSPPR